jgi:AcrR family transcriptional regulator
MSSKKNYREIRYQEKKISILQSAARFFSIKGYEKATLEEIANELNMTKGSLYYYIKSKEDMLFQCHMKALEEANKVLELVKQSDLSPEIKMRNAIMGHIKVITEEFVVGTLRQQELLLPQHMHERVVRERDKFERNFLKILTEGIKKQVFEEKDVKMRAYAILGAINWIPRWYSPKGKLTPEKIGDAMAIYLINGLAGSVSFQMRRGAKAGKRAD